MSQDDSQITQKEISGIEGSHLLQNDSGDTVHVMQSVEFSGPLPHPVILKGYNDIHPDFAKEVLEFGKREQSFRHQKETRESIELLSQAKLGQHYALTICLTALVCTVILGVTGHEASAAIIGGLDLVALALVFIIGRSNTTKITEPTDEKQ